MAGRRRAGRPGSPTFTGTTWASRHVQLGTPLYVLKELGGWETLEIVKRYAHLAPEHLKAHAERLQLGPAVTAQIRHGEDGNRARNIA